MTSIENGSGADPAEKKSRTLKKKEALSLQELGERLLGLSAEQIEDMGLPTEICDALTEARTIRSRGARRRQKQYIGSLMRKVDVEPIRDALRDIEEGGCRKAMVFKETENWRDELVSGNSVLLEQILERYPDADRQRLTQLVRKSVRERELSKAPTAARALFRYLSTIRSD
ncbi:MAG: DUF615 domain-containing protein [Nitrospiraceae bacterium]|nr:MAG: DUF615 domain-containing protein [Nitrospiraceae bacterium]